MVCRKISPTLSNFTQRGRLICSMESWLKIFHQVGCSVDSKLDYVEANSIPISATIRVEQSSVEYVPSFIRLNLYFFNQVSNTN